LFLFILVSSSLLLITPSFLVAMRWMSEHEEARAACVDDRFGISFLVRHSRRRSLRTRNGASQTDTKSQNFCSTILVSIKTHSHSQIHKYSTKNPFQRTLVHERHKTNFTEVVMRQIKMYTRGVLSCVNESYVDMGLITHESYVLNEGSRYEFSIMCQPQKISCTQHTYSTPRESRQCVCVCVLSSHIIHHIQSALQRLHREIPRFFFTLQNLLKISSSPHISKDPQLKPISHLRLLTKFSQKKE
jgi:hypothetical protein